METLENTLQVTHDWAVDRLHILCDLKTDDVLRSVEDAHAIQSEFAEWLDPNLEDHEIYSLEYLGDND
jgi:Holliday junction resolvasome RuvABC ATP-dependent DNA helicase subunit